MAPTSRQIRQLIREELSRALREEEDDRVVIDWSEGPIDEKWVANRLNLYSDLFDNDVSGFAQVADELVKMLEGEPIDRSIGKHYLNPDGTSKYTRGSVEDLATKMLNILDDVAARQAEIDRRRRTRP